MANTILIKNASTGTPDDDDVVEGELLIHTHATHADGRKLYFGDSADALRTFKISGFDNDSSYLTSINNSNWSGTDLSVANGGTGASTLGDGYLLLGSGTGAITALDVTTKGSILVGDGSGDPRALAVGGTNDHVLTVASGETTGLKWAAVSGGGGGSFDDFILTGDSGSNQTIDDGETLDIAGGTGLDSVVGATNTVTLNIDSTVCTLTGGQTLTNKVLTSPDINGGTLSAITIDGNWTAASQTCANLGSVTTCDINGGTINGITDLAITDGGTGASNSNAWLNSRITTNANGTLNYDATGATAVNHDSLAGFASGEHYTQASIVATSALDSGSITSNFGAINNGSSGITASTLGVTVVANLKTISLNDVTFTATGTEINLLDGSVANTVVNSKAVIYGSSGEVNATSITSDGGIDIDNFNIDGTTIALSSGDLTLSSGAANIIFDAGGDSLFHFQDDGATRLTIAAKSSAGTDFGSGVSHGHGGYISLNTSNINTDRGNMVVLGEGSGTHMTAFRAPDSLGADLVYILPATAPTADQVLECSAVNSSPTDYTLAWADAGGGGGGADTQLSNLSGTVAIPVTIASDTDNTDDLGSLHYHWRDIYFKGSMNTSAGVGLSATYTVGTALMPLGPGAYALATQEWTFTDGILTAVA